MGETVSETRHRWKIRLLVRTSQEDELPIEAELDQEATVTDLVEALGRAAAVGLDPSRAHSARLGRLDPAERVADTGLRAGDRLDFDGSARTTTERDPANTVELVVVAGPLAGRRVPLSGPRQLIGRAGDADILLDDPLLSRRHLWVECDDRGVVVEDAGSTNGSFIDGARLTAPRRVDPADVIEIGATLLRFEPKGTQGHDVARAQVVDGTIPFNRPPRVMSPIENTTIEVPAPPDEAAQVRLPLGAALLPLALGLVLYALTKEVTMLAFMALSPVMAVWSFFENRNAGSQRYKKEKAKWDERIAALEAELENGIAREVELRRAGAPEPDEIRRRAQHVAPSLWERRPGDPDLLHIRFGWGDQPSRVIYTQPHSGSETLRTEVATRLERFRTAPAVPVIVPLASHGVIGLCGDPADVAALARWIVIQTAGLHSPEDVAIGLLVGADVDDMSWAGWLPHVVGEASPLPRPRIARDAETATPLLEGVKTLIENRERAPRSESVSDLGPAIVLFVDGSLGLPRATLGPVLKRGPKVGVYTVWLGQDIDRLPGESQVIAQVGGGDQLRLTFAGTGETMLGLGREGITPELALEIATALAPIKETAAGSADHSIPPHVSLFDCLEVDRVDARTVGERWQRADGSLKASIGVSSGGPNVLDLQGDGPHVLIGGTTGAGKSELLQTLVSSFAARYSPARLNFLLLDYKGGAAFKDCVALPHVVGFVTDLDGSLARRALISLDAELKKRERAMKEAGVRDLVAMRQAKPDDAPPSLVIVIDEFATLVKELPEFVDGVVDVAQRGRSLGVHLILATQRPAGVINDNIRANTNLRIALRVGDVADSHDVIGAAEAAYIPRHLPGRCYIRTGHGEVTEVQTAYAGTASARRDTTPVVVRPLSDGEPVLARASAVDTRSDLIEVVEACRESFAGSGAERPPSPWLPPLPATLPLESLRAEAPAVDEPAARAVIGLADEPATQRQLPLALDLAADGSTLIFGTGGSGKTTALVTIARSMAASCSPRQLWLYGLDFAGGLGSLEALPHCGSVIAGDDQERVEQLFTFLGGQIRARRAAFASSGAGTLAAYNAAAPEPERIPRIVVLLDSYAGFASAFERVDFGALVESLPRLIADGRPLGLHFVITVDRRGALPNSVASIVSSRIVLRMGDPDEYAALGLDARTAKAMHFVPGRGFWGGREVQIAEATAPITSIPEARPSTGAAPRIEILPGALSRTALPDPSPNTAWLGLAHDLRPAGVDLADGHFLVVGPYKSGRSTALGALARSFGTGTPKLELHLVAPRRTPLTELDLWTSVATGTEGCSDAVARLERRVTDEPSARLVVFIDDADELTDLSVTGSLEKIVRMTRDRDIRVIASGETTAVQRTFGGWLTEMRKEKHGLLLSPDTDVDGDLLGVRLPRRTNRSFPPGRGYLIKRGAISLVQVAS